MLIFREWRLFYLTLSSSLPVINNYNFSNKPYILRMLKFLNTTLGLTNADIGVIFLTLKPTIK